MQAAIARAKEEPVLVFDRAALEFLDGDCVVLLQIFHGQVSLIIKAAESNCIESAIKHESSIFIRAWLADFQVGVDSVVRHQEALLSHDVES